MLLLFCAAGALLAAASAVQSVVSSTEATRQIEVWRLFGLLMFAGVFALLALRPSGYRGLLELAIANKLALTIVELALIPGGARDASSSAAVDGALTLLLIVAYLLRRISPRLDSRDAGS